nr:hypothetical protein [Tepidiforma sp.]
MTAEEMDLVDGLGRAHLAEPRRPVGRERNDRHAGEVRLGDSREEIRDGRA